MDDRWWNPGSSLLEQEVRHKQGEEERKNYLIMHSKGKKISSFEFEIPEGTRCILPKNNRTFGEMADSSSGMRTVQNKPEMSRHT